MQVSEAKKIIEENQDIKEISEKICSNCEINCESVIVIAYITIIIVNMIKIYLACKDKFPLLSKVIKRPRISHRAILRREINSNIPDGVLDKVALESYILSECKKLSEQRLEKICSNYSL